MPRENIELQKLRLGGKQNNVAINRQSRRVFCPARRPFGCIR